MTKAGKKETAVRGFFSRNHKGTVPSNLTVQQLYSAFMAAGNSADVSYGLFNGVVKKMRSDSAILRIEVQEPAAPKTPKAEVIEIGRMKFPNFRAYKTGGIIDRLFSDHTADGGIFSGTANIVIGESGVGKSTVTLDILSKIKKEQPDAKILYISSEMTRNDIMFYYRKTPAIGKVPTLLLMDYVKNGQLAQVLEKSFNGEHDVILLDSYQDVLVKLKEVHGWKSTKAESWLTNMMIDAAEKCGNAVLAIQHMTKGGQYVGSTYLKHATTAMLEIRFDLTGQRYIEFSKNRRGGSGTGKRLYYKLDETGAVVYDVARFNETEEMRNFENVETLRQQDLTAQFENIFLGGSRHLDEDSVEEAETDEDLVKIIEE